MNARHEGLEKGTGVTLHFESLELVLAVDAVWPMLLRSPKPEEDEGGVRRDALLNAYVAQARREAGLGVEDGVKVLLFSLTD